MITQLQTSVFKWIYSAAEYRFTVIPVMWKNGRPFLTPNPIRIKIGIGLVCTIVILKIIIAMIQISRLSGTGNISLITLKSVLALRDAYYILLQINTWIYRMEFVRLINQCLDIDSIWGN